MTPATPMHTEVCTMRDVTWGWRDHRRGSMKLAIGKTSLLGADDLQRISSFKQSILESVSHSLLAQLAISLDSPRGFSVRMSHNEGENSTVQKEVHVGLGMSLEPSDPGSDY
jgi:hypothetical protein